MRLAKATLKIFSYLEILMGILFIGVGIYSLTNYPAVADKFLKIKFVSSNSKNAVMVACIIIALFYFLYAYLMRIALKNGQKTTLLMILLIIGILGSISSIVKIFSVATLISLLINVFVLYQVIVLRKKN